MNAKPKHNGVTNSLVAVNGISCQYTQPVNALVSKTYGVRMKIETLFGAQPRFRMIGTNKANMSCPGPLHKHGDRNPSLSVRETPDGVILLKCWAGCSNAEILQAIGLDFADLFPTTASFHLPKIRRPFSAADALTGLSFESLVLLQFAKMLENGEILSDVERTRLLLFSSRIQRAQESCV